jgi:hypothetical protein
MNARKKPAQLAPAELPRQRRRHIDRALHRLAQRDDCSICGSPLPHNSRTAAGLDAGGNAVVAGECCFSKVAVAFASGLYIKQRYDFFDSTSAKSDAPPPTNEQISEAIAAYQKAVADADERLAGIERRGGVESGKAKAHLLDHPWKTDDRIWFERNPQRSHRVREPFPGEAEQPPPAVAGHTLIVLVRQVEPGSRIRRGFYLNSELLPVPDSEAIAHMLFDIATRREPVPHSTEAIKALIDRYNFAREGS